ncbi:hypothetical protein ANCDUO_17328 [Ancylostoma duodenale]|uniref:MSP domain-containing protein n=1 Tax=Ancylostoma duodenale TaxID=51022 RepID=A0A0C2G0Z9_9BILA|nr:hypothetical protein ANCDUO_17328 [Ancylostoma duodenale]
MYFRKENSMAAERIRKEFIETTAAVSPVGINTQLDSYTVFSAPYDDKHNYRMKMVNSSRRCIEWVIKTINMRQFGVDTLVVCSTPRGPPHGFS